MCMTKVADNTAANARMNTSKQITTASQISQSVGFLIGLPVSDTRRLVRYLIEEWSRLQLP